MYRASAIALANTLADLPFSAVRVLLFDIIVFFMSVSGACKQYEQFGAVTPVRPTFYYLV